MQSASLYGGGIDGFGETGDAKTSRLPLFSTIFRRWKLVLGITLACLAIVSIRLYFITPHYRSEARVFLRRGALQVSGDSGNSYASNLQTQCRVITSSRIVALAAARALPKAPKTLSSGNAGAAMGRIVEGLAASVPMGEDLIAIAFEGPDAAEAAVVLQSVVDVFSEYHNDRKLQALSQWQNDLSRLQSENEARNTQLDGLRKKSEESVDGAGVGGTAREDLAVLRETLNVATGEALNAQTAMESYDPSRAVAGGAGEDSAILLMRGQLAAARDHLRDVRSRYLENHPQIIAAVSQVTTLEASVNQAEARAAEAQAGVLKQRHVVATERRNRVQKQYKELAKAVARQSRDSTEIDRLEAEVVRAQKQMDSIIARMTSFRLDADASSGTVEVVDFPSIQLDAVRPNKSRNVTFALVGGLVLGALSALTLGALDKRVRGAADLAVMMRLPVLGAIPVHRGVTTDHALGTLVANDPTCDTAEAFRSVRTAVLFTSEVRDPRTILITSAQADEGKSTLAANLAISLAQAGRRVLLLDADLRKPVQNKIFQTLARGDLEKILAGDQTIESATQAGEVAQLSMLLCGHAPMNPSELLNSPAFAALLEELSVRYDHVVIDSPPVSVASDARILSAFAAVTVLVVRADKTRHDMVKLAFESLVSVGGTVLGMVLNRASQRSDHFGSHGYEYSKRKRLGNEERATNGGGAMIPLPYLNKTQADLPPGQGLNSGPV